MIIKFAALTLFMTGLSACSLIQRSEQSGYIDPATGPSTVQNFYQEKSLKRVSEAREQLGISGGRPLTEEEQAAVRARMEVSKLERRLRTESEKKQYYSLKPFFKNDWERAQFLKLPDRETRQRFADSKGIASEESQLDFATNQLVENSDIAKGMSKTAVKQSWGEPDTVEAAGNPVYGNERWIYKKLVSSEEGYKHETRFVYFESGRVIGWETE